MKHLGIIGSSEPRLARAAVAAAALWAVAVAPRPVEAQPPDDQSQQADRQSDAGQQQEGQSDDDRAAGPLEEVVVFGRGIELLGTADAASEGTVAGADLLVRPMLRVAEMLEAVPGMVAAQHSGSGKANQYFLRGFNLDHGTDFTTYVDGMPWNLRSHGHGQGYLDLNGLMPQIVDEMDYRKGPYRADVGDFATVGASFITTVDRFEAPFVSFETGDYGWGRLAAGGSTDAAGGTLTGIAEVKTYDGPWELAEHLRHKSAWGKYLHDTDFGQSAYTLSYYEADWRPTEQIPERAIGTPVCEDVFCALDTTATGHTTRWIFGSQLTGESWDAQTYLQYYDWQMQSDPTYDFQINQFDKRVTLGGRVAKTVVSSSNVDVDVGAELRYDDIGPVGVDHFLAGQFVDNISSNDVKEGSLGVYTETTWYATDSLRLMGGLRGDYYNFDVTARTPGSYAGTETDSQLSPTAGLAYAIGDRIELYGNWGKGFHSNDARGVVNDSSSVPGLSTGTGYEAGTRIEVGDVKLTGAYWWLNQDSELIFVGDTNSVEPKGASNREGYELTLFWRPADWLGIDAVYTGSDARYVDNPDGSHIEGAIEHAGQLGVSATRERWEASMRLRYLGPYALVPDNSHRATGGSTINLRGAYHFDRFTIYADLLNATDDQMKDIVYWYPAYVEGLDPPGLTSADIDCSAVDCRMSRIREPRTLRVGVTVSF